MSKVKAGEAYVEIGGDPRKLFAALSRAQRQLGQLGSALSGVGRNMIGVGVAIAAPIGAAVVAGSRFQDVMLNVRASTGATADELEKVRKSAMDASQALGVGPTEAAAGFLELLKAGMSVQQVLGGAGKAAIQFAKVGGLQVSDAAVVMADAMNVFKVTADTAANTLSAAADASSTSIEGIAQAFSQVSAVAGLANQTIQDTAAALAVLANAGVKGSDAGTSLKTMLLRLMAPAEDAAKALGEIGLSTQSFRNADGTMKPLVEIIRTLTTAMQGMDQAAKDDIFRRIFGQDAIRAAAVLTQAGVEGFAAMQNGMGGALKVGQKFDELQSGLSGAANKLKAALERLGIAISDAVGPAMMDLAKSIQPIIDGFSKFVSANQELVGQAAKMVAGLIVVGGALVVVGLNLRIAAFGLGAFVQVAKTAIAPIALVAKTAIYVGSAFANVFGTLGGSAAAGVSAVLRFATSSGVALARASAGFGTLAVNAAASATSIAASMTGTALAGVMRFVRLGLAGVAQYSARSTAILAVAAAQSGAMAAAQTATTVSIVSAVVARAAEGNLQAAGMGVRALRQLGVAGTTQALVASAAVARLGTNGTQSLARLGASGTQSIARIGTTALTVSASSSTAIARVATSFAAVSARGVASLGAISSASNVASASVGGIAAVAGQTVRATVTGFQYAARASAASLAATGQAAAVSFAGAVRAASVFSATSIAAFVRTAAAAVASAATSTAAWVAGLARMTAATAISGVAMAAGFLAPFAAIGAAIVGAGVLIYAFRDQIGEAFGGVGQAVSQAAGYIGQGFTQSVADATVVFGDLFKTATVTFDGIYEAIANGDLSGAMDVLWAGLQAGWLRGVEALMGFVDPWISLFQNTFTVLGAEIFKIWDTIWVNVSNTFNTFGAYILGAFDNIINPILAAWDTLEAGILKSWNRIQSFIKRGFDLKKENEKVDSEMAARRREREVNRPGIEGRTKQAEDANAQAVKDRDQRAAAVDANTQATVDAREAKNEQNRRERRAATQAAEANVANAGRGKREARAQNEQFADLLKRIEGAQSISDLRDMYGEFDALSSNGRLSETQISTLEAALEAAQERVTKADVHAGIAARGGGGGGTSPEDMKRAAQEAAASQAEVAGTFSAHAVGGMGFGGSLQQKANELLGKIEQNTRQDAGAQVAA